MRQQLEGLHVINYRDAYPAAHLVSLTVNEKSGTDDAKCDSQCEKQIIRLGGFKDRLARHGVQYRTLLLFECFENILE